MKNIEYICSEEKLKNFLEMHPFYTGNGVATQDTQDEILYTYDDWLEEFKRDEMPLIDTVNICLNWFSKYDYNVFCYTDNRQRRRIMKQHLHPPASTSYGLKHVIEDMEETYISNVACIIAASMSGIPMYYHTTKKMKSWDAPDTRYCISPNLVFKSKSKSEYRDGEYYYTAKFNRYYPLVDNTGKQVGWTLN